jgi:hypothetical protein
MGKIGGDSMKKWLLLILMVCLLLGAAIGTALAEGKEKDSGKAEAAIQPPSGKPTAPNGHPIGHNNPDLTRINMSGTVNSTPEWRWIDTAGLIVFIVLVGGLILLLRGRGKA